MTPTRKLSRGWLMAIVALSLAFSTLACSIGGMNLPLPDLFGPAATPTIAATATKAGCTVPTLTGKDQSIAEAALSVLGLKANITEKYNPAMNKGMVITQSPLAGTELTPCEGTVELVVSLGAPEATATPTKVPTTEPAVKVTDIPYTDEPMYNLDYYEGFEDRTDGFDSYWYTYLGDNSSAETVDGDLELTGQVDAFTSDETWADYIFSVNDVFYADAGTFTIYFRVVDETHYYKLDCEIGADSSADCSFKEAIDSWEDLVPGTEVMEDVCWGYCSFTIEAEGSSYRFLVDSYEVGSFEDDMYMEGGIGIGVNTEGTYWISEMTLVEPSKPASAGAPLMVDEFDTNTWPVGEEDSEWDTLTQEIADGVYHWDIKAKKGVAYKQMLNADYVLPDTFTFVVEATHTSGNEDGGYGVIFQTLDYDNFYYFAIRNSGTVEMWALDNEEWIELVPETEFDGIYTDDYNEIAVVANGSHYVVYVNGTMALEFEDDRFNGGTIGLAVDLYEKGDTLGVDWDNIQVWVP